MRVEAGRSPISVSRRGTLTVEARLGYSRTCDAQSDEYYFVLESIRKDKTSSCAPSVGRLDLGIS
jgi:hypothetical protein